MKRRRSSQTEWSFSREKGNYFFSQLYLKESRENPRELKFSHKCFTFFRGKTLVAFSFPFSHFYAALTTEFIRFKAAATLNCRPQM